MMDFRELFIALRPHLSNELKQLIEFLQTKVK